MGPFFAMARKQLVESRWFLAIAAAALFGLSWLFVFAASRIEARMRQETNPVERLRGAGFIRGMGGKNADASSTSIEVAFWRHPFIILIVLSWAIARGSVAAGEVERGTMDLVLARPVSRTSYLASQVVVAVFGLFVLGAAMVAGNLAAGRYNPVEAPPGPSALDRAAFNLAVLGLAVYGYTFLLGAVASVRWLVSLAASVLTIGGFIANVVANIPTLDYLKWLEKVSIFTAYDPVEAARKAENLAFNASILGGIGAAGILLGWLAFQYRDLPTNA